MILRLNLERINFSEERFSIKTSIRQLWDDVFTYNLMRNEVIKIMERPAERGFIILKRKIM